MIPFGRGHLFDLVNGIVLFVRQMKRNYEAM